MTAEQEAHPDGPRLLSSIHQRQGRLDLRRLRRLLSLFALSRCCLVVRQGERQALEFAEVKVSSDLDVESPVHDRILKPHCSCDDSDGSWGFWELAVGGLPCRGAGAWVHTGKALLARHSGHASGY